MSPRASIRVLATQPDERLVALARDGHERAFEALVRRHRRPLLRYCRRLRVSDARAEDVVQQALTKAWLALARDADVREPRAWLHRIVHNTAVNAMRAAREVPTEPAAVVRDGAHVEASELDSGLAVRDALGHVAALPAMQRDAVLLTAVEGCSHDEVARSLGVSRGAVRGLLYRARTTLRSAAAALTPAPLIEWASRGAETAAPGAERIAELTAGAGVAGVAGALAKGVAVAVGVGALATGVAVKLHHSAPAQRSDARSRLTARASIASGGALVTTGEATTSGEATMAAGADVADGRVVPAARSHDVPRVHTRTRSSGARLDAIARGGGRWAVIYPRTPTRTSRSSDRTHGLGDVTDGRPRDGGGLRDGGWPARSRQRGGTMSGDIEPQRSASVEPAVGEADSREAPWEDTTTSTRGAGGSGEHGAGGGEPLGGERERAHASATSSDAARTGGGESTHGEARSGDGGKGS